MKQNKKATILVAFLLTLSLAACGSPVNQIVEDLDKANYAEAVSAANDLNEKDYADLCQKLDQKLDETVNAYAAEEIKQKDALGLIDAIEQMHISAMQSATQIARRKINELVNSKKSFLSGTQMYQDNDYLSAMKCFSQVIEEDCRHEDAVKLMHNCSAKYGNTVIEKTQEYISRDDIDGAMYYLNNCKREAAAFEETETLVLNLINDMEIESTLNQAKELVKQGDIPAALTTVTEYINETKTDDKRLTDFLDTTHKEYVEMILKKVSELSEKENYISALKMLKNAKEVVEDEAFDQEEAKIKAVKPTYLYDLTCSNNYKYEVIDDGDPLTDTIGNKYDVGNLFTIAYDSWKTTDDHHNGNAEYYLGYQYDRFTGLIAVDENSPLNEGQKEQTAVLRIIGDGETLYSTTVKRSYAPTSFDVDISNVNWLKISLAYEDGSGWGNQELTVILADCIFPDD